MVFKSTIFSSWVPTWKKEFDFGLQAKELEKILGLKLVSLNFAYRKNSGSRKVMWGKGEPPSS